MDKNSFLQMHLRQKNLCSFIEKGKYVFKILSEGISLKQDKNVMSHLKTLKSFLGNKCSPNFFQEKWGIKKLLSFNLGPISKKLLQPRPGLKKLLKCQLCLSLASIF